MRPARAILVRGLSRWNQFLPIAFAQCQCVGSGVMHLTRRRAGRMIGQETQDGLDEFVVGRYGHAGFLDE